MWHYERPDAAIRDALRLSEGMSYKNAVAGLACGGGKGVIVRPSGPPPHGRARNAALRDFGDLVQECGGSYMTAEDVGMAERDMAVIAKRTTHVCGRSTRAGGSGDPSPWTALGVLTAIETVCERLHGSRELRGRSVAVIGLGHVGLALAQMLAAAGARLVVSDIDRSKRDHAKALGARWLTPARALAAPVDVVAPCALGGVLHAESVAALQAGAVTGAANNQLADESVAGLLQRAGILWAPDFVVNAGGVINIGVELRRGGYDPKVARRRVLGIGDTLAEILDDAAGRQITTLAAAMERARALLFNGGGAGGCV